MATWTTKDYGPKPLWTVEIDVDGIAYGDRPFSIVLGDTLYVESRWYKNGVLTNPAFYKDIYFLPAYDPPSGSYVSQAFDAGTETNPSTGVMNGAKTPDVVGRWWIQIYGDDGGSTYIRDYLPFYVVRSNQDPITPGDYS